LPILAECVVAVVVWNSRRLSALKCLGASIMMIEFDSRAKARQVQTVDLLVIYTSR
jgi:hypothetical protein